MISEKSGKPVSKMGGSSFSVVFAWSLGFYLLRSAGMKEHSLTAL